MRTILGLDFDGVIIDPIQPKIAIARKIGFRIEPHQTPAGILKKLMPESEYEKFKYLLYDDPETALNCSLTPGFAGFIEKIRENDVPYFIISRRKENFDIPVMLLQKHSLWPDYFNEKNLFFVAEKEDKNKKAVELGVTHYIDDDPKVLDKLTDVKHRILFDPLGVFNTSEYKVISSWDDLLTRRDFLLGF